MILAIVLRLLREDSFGGIFVLHASWASDGVTVVRGLSFCYVQLACKLTNGSHRCTILQKSPLM